MGRLQPSLPLARTSRRKSFNFHLCLFHYKKMLLLCDVVSNVIHWTLERNVLLGISSATIFQRLLLLIYFVDDNTVLEDYLPPEQLRTMLKTQLEYYLSRYAIGYSFEVVISVKYLNATIIFVAKFVYFVYVSVWKQKANNVWDCQWKIFFHPITSMIQCVS